MSELALLGGGKAVTINKPDLFAWPIITQEDEEAVLEVLRRGGMSSTDVTKKFEEEFAQWQKRKYALGFHNGTAALQAAMFGLKIGVGDEIICPSITYWASCLPVYSLGGTVVFADINPESLCIEPTNIEQWISPKTKAIVVVHYAGHPADMDPIMDIAEKHGIPVIEDVSHAHGGLYKGRLTGTFGEVAAMSMMSGKSFATGEMGAFVTDNREIVDRAVAFGHYDRFNADFIQTEYLKPYAGLPMGGYKYRVHQLSSAVARVQLKYYNERIKVIQDAMNYFWDLLDDVPGLKDHRPSKESGSTMGGWYAAKGMYKKDELGGLSLTRFAEAVRAEGSECSPGANLPLHLHPLFNTLDVYGHGKPTRIANSDRDLRQPEGSLPVAEQIGKTLFSIPWFKHFRKEEIEQHALAYRKAAENCKALLKDDPGDPETMGSWHSFQFR
ncbi:MAG: DegT/DnrJ/EryC1/StrS family aminotransferase [Spirochaetia bacterium]